jgi:hypothetical protein
MRSRASSRFAARTLLALLAAVGCKESGTLGGSGSAPQNIADPMPPTSNGGHLPIVTTGAPASVIVQPKRLAMIVGQVVQLIATVRGSDGSVLAVASEWATDDPSRASVSPSGLVKALGAGTVRIVVTYEGIAGDCTVTIQ